MYSFFSDPPKVLLEYGSKINSNDIKEGEDTYMECKVQGNPKPHKLQWFHNVSTLPYIINRDSNQGNAQALFTLPERGSLV